MHGEDPTQGLGAGARVERTKHMHMHMSLMSETLDVSKAHARGKARGPKQGTGGAHSEHEGHVCDARGVPQLEMSASKFFKFWKRGHMSVMAETSQSAMGPYVAMAAVGLASNTPTAFSGRPWS